MKKLIASILVCMPIVAFAENVEAPQIFWAQKPVQCGDPKDIIKIPEQYGEKPMMTGDGLAVLPNGSGMPVRIVFGVNTETGTWTLIEINGENQACVLGSGKNLTLIKPDNSNKVGT
tara:strand:+ start:1048 stop:1398 length:351 start_codon:yes stop_codon:yes gene_type:complete